MFSIEMTLILVSIISSNGFDPDSDICDRPVLDSSIYSDDGTTYIFKGKYYWKTKQLESHSGIEGFAGLISDKWPEITEPLIASFYVLGTKFVTFLVSKTHWFAYHKKQLIHNGSIAKWPQFHSLSVNTIFSKDLKKSEIYVIHNQSTHYIIYDFNNILEPKIVTTGPTTTWKNFLWFLDEDHKNTATLKDILEVQTSIRYKDILILMSKEKYCRVDLRAPESEKKCEPNERIYDLFNCPLDLDQRPTTTTTTTTTIRTTITLTTNETTEEFTKETPYDYSTIGGTDGSNETNSKTPSESQSSFYSNVTVLVIIAVVVVLVFGVFIAVIIVLVNKNKTTTDNTSISRFNTTSKINSKESIASDIRTVHSVTGVPTKSNSYKKETVFSTTSNPINDRYKP